MRPNVGTSSIVHGAARRKTARDVRVTNNLLPIVMIWLGLTWAWPARVVRVAIDGERAILPSR